MTLFNNKSLQIDDLTIESSEDKVSFYGSIDFDRSKEGLEKALRVQNVLNAMILSMQNEELPEKIEVIERKTVPNPFTF